MTRGIARAWQRTLLLTAVLLMAAPAVAVRAQDGKWWESIEGFGKSTPSSRASNEERRKPEVLIGTWDSAESS